jgi:hypothetical protein
LLARRKTVGDAKSTRAAEKNGGEAARATDHGEAGQDQLIVARRRY